MTLNLGNGVARTLTPEQQQLLTVVFQKGKPPTDHEMNLAQQVQTEALATAIRRIMPSGWLIDPTLSTEDFLTEKNWSNFFKIGNPALGETTPVLWANVNGWLIPVAGTNLTTEGDVSNRVRLNPPPSSDSRIDFVFLEVWLALVQPNPATTNKPEASKLWKYGNVEFGQTNIDDDLQDPTIGFETTRRVQLQYRLRVFGTGEGLGSSVALDVYPDGLGDPNVLAQGAADTPQTGFTFENMRDELGDPGLWRAGDGNANNSLGTADGRVYAVPLAAVFRRNSSTFTAVNLAGNPNQNGAFNRNPSASFLTNPREGAKVLTTATLNSVLTPTATGDIEVLNLVDSGFDDPKHTISNVFMVIDDEIIGISSVNSASTPGTITIPSGGRGRGGTRATRHEAGAVVEFYSVRPDGLFADEIAEEDILDLRRAVNPGDWDYQRLLLHNVASLIENRLRSTWKVSAVGDTQGASVVEVDLMHADGSTTALNQTEPVDGPDGIRTVFSDSASIQTDVTVLCDNDASLTGGFTTDQFDTNAVWGVGADFKPSGFVNNLGASGSFGNGSVFFLHIGGDNGTQGARATFRDGSTRAVRFLSPQEWWKTSFADGSTGRQYPVTLRFLDQYAQHPLAPGELTADADADTKHPGPYYPLREANFERPFIVLGGLLHPTLKISGLDSDSVGSASPGLVSGPNGPELDLGLDFDIAGGFYSLDASGDFANDPSEVNTALLRGQRTLYDMLTNGGRDGTGASSEVYIVLYGDTAFRENNGAFRVIGAGTIGYTNRSASNATSVILEPLSDGVTDFTIAAGETLTAEFRSQITNVEDGNGFAAADPALAIVLTDIQGNHLGTANPWNSENLGSGSGFDHSIPSQVSSKLQINCTLMYHPGRGGMARVADEVWRASLVQAGNTYLRQAIGTVDTTFPSVSGYPSQETEYDTVPVGLWNRLPSLGLTENSAPKAPDFGGNVVAFSEQDREHEVFVDKGSKTVILRPFQNQSMTLKAITTEAVDGLLGDTNYPGAIPKDGAGIFTAGQKMGFPIPSEYMPRFGRQDIPFHIDITGDGSGTFLNGINHLFTDAVDPTLPVFSLIGGQDNSSGGNLVRPMYFQTGTTSGHAYGVYGTIVGPGTDAYQARLTTSIGTLTSEAADITARLNAVQSSDLRAGLVGIQLPPYLGIARLYGVYDRDDFISKSGLTFGTDRVTPVANPPTNLLKTDAEQQTLFIFQDGAKDLTQTDGDHTYIVPEEAIDITLSPNYTPGSQFSDFEYVVEAAVFGFAQGWINENNYVLARLHTGTGATVVDGSDPELEAVNMTLPSAAQINDRFYLGYNRTPYQGDPFMTREGSSRTTSDYEVRYGQVSLSDAFFLNEPIEQFDSNGDLQVETPNARGFEVLSSIDFFTTLGTGKVAGALFPGTPLDVGYTEDTPRASSRLPETQTDPSYRVLTRAFTEGQKENVSRASIDIRINAPETIQATGSVEVVAATAGDTITIGGVVLTGVAGARTPGSDDFDATLATPPLLAAEIAAAINDGANSFTGTVTASNTNQYVLLTAVPIGEAGNSITLATNNSANYLFPEGTTLEGGVSRGLTSSELTIRKLDGTLAVFEGGNISVGNTFNASVDPETTVRDLVRAINESPDTSFSVTAEVLSPRIVRITSLTTGERGNDLEFSWTTSGFTFSAETALEILVPFDNVGPFNERQNSRVTRARFAGGRDLVNNAGDGTSQLRLTGMTERLPLGVLLQDSDFIGENPLNDQASAFATATPRLRPVQTVLPLTTGGNSFERFLGDPGQLIGMSDGAVLRYEAFNSATAPTGTKKYRLYRGGGAAFVLSGGNPGGPLDWVSESFPASVLPVLKGGILACKALLVRNYREEAFATDDVVSDGDEIQMVVLTYGVLGDGRAQIDGIQLDGVISPTGYGEGYAAADRYRCEGKPMFAGFSRSVPNPDDVSLAVFPGNTEE